MAYSQNDGPLLAIDRITAPNISRGTKIGFLFRETPHIPSSDPSTGLPSGL